MKTSKRLWIVEGPAGAGKTTLATALAEATGAHYVHLGLFPRVDRGLARLYVDAMMPAVLGMSDVVLDRSWLSERPYGVAYRHGDDRLGFAVRALERLAWRCQTLVVRCLPPSELLDTPEELLVAYNAYQVLQTSLPMVTINPLDRPTRLWIEEIVRHPGASVPHALNVPSAGNLRGSVTLVGEAFTATTDRDPLYQWPFGSLCREGCSAWLAEQLDAADVNECDLFWINADALTPAIRDHRVPVIALGTVAAQRLIELGRVPNRVVPHPREGMRSNEPYRLIEVLREICFGERQPYTRAHDFGVLKCRM